jgi:hypothetical protein
MGGHGLRVFERAAGLEIRGDTGCAEHVTAEPITVAVNAMS